MADRSEGDDKESSQAERRESRAQRKAARAERDAQRGRTERPTRLCSLSTVEVKKGDFGYQMLISGGERRYKLIIPADQIGQITKDIETAIQVIRGDQ